MNAELPSIESGEYLARIEWRFAGCMGGWCAVRESCARYRAGGARPVERMCSKGGKDAFEPMWQVADCTVEAS